MPNEHRHPEPQCPPPTSWSPPPIQDTQVIGLLLLARSIWMSGFPSRNNKTQMGSSGATFIQPKCGRKLGDPQLPVKGSGQGSEYSWRHRIAMWRVFVSHGVPTVYGMYPGGGGLPETTGGTHSGRGIWEQFCPIEVPMDATWGSQYGVQSF